MKLTKKSIEKDKSGFVVLIAEDPEDMWHLYNLIQKGDVLKANTVRKVVNETSTGSTTKSSVRMNLTISIEEIDFDVQACSLRVNGRNIVENEHVKMGQYHTIDLELNRQFTLSKTEWDLFSLDRIHEACNITNKADIAAIVMQEGLANLCLLTQSMTIVKQRIEKSIPRKRIGSTSQHEKGIEKFFNQIYAAILANINFDIVKVLIIASPGFLKDQFYVFMNSMIIKTENRVLLDNRNKIILIHCSSGQKHALQEVLQDPTIQNRLADTKYSIEVKTLERFYNMLSLDNNRAFYGFDHVSYAAEHNAIDTMMVTDGLFRSANIQQRRQYIALVEKVKAQGAQVLIFSSLHSSGEQLTNLTGVAAILHYPLAEIDDNKS